MGSGLLGNAPKTRGCLGNRPLVAQIPRLGVDPRPLAIDSRQSAKRLPSLLVSPVG